MWLQLSVSEREKKFQMTATQLPEQRCGSCWN
jgi:hypothetical protein